MAEAADGPDGAAATECDLAVERPDTGSALVDGHNARAGFLRTCDPSPLVVPFVWFGLAGIVVVEELEDIEEDELDLRMNMRLTSSGVIAFRSS